ncbi:MAG TPA: MerR family transcriptional regulator [Burkholderiaceae bacterium]|nr:MerR family transcriptional regulator [Burkholderiaceae bacterium]
MVADTLTIGQVSRASGVHVETIRYYQGLGIVRAPQRPAGGFRRYGEVDVARLRFIKRAQHLGFTLDEVRSLLQLEDGQSCRETRLLAENKLAVVEQRISDLNRIWRLLKQLIGECEAGKRPRTCPIIATLASAD